MSDCNCEPPLDGEFCKQCGAHYTDLHEVLGWQFGYIKKELLNTDNTATRYQAYDDHSQPIEGATETALEESEASRLSALTAVVLWLLNHQYAPVLPVPGEEVYVGQ